MADNLELVGRNTPGADGIGNHMSGDGVGAKAGATLTTDVTRQVSPGLLKDKYDDQIVQMGFTSAYINAMTRKIGYKTLKSMRYNYFSVDLRAGKDAVKTQFVVPSDLQQVQSVVVKVAKKFDVTDQIAFRVAGVKSINALVRGIDLETNTLKVQFINGAGTTIKADVEIYILGHAASETDATTVPYSELPAAREQYMQKFMVQSLISNIQLESEKNASWERSDINELMLQQFIEDVEKTYLFSNKGYLWDATNRSYTYTTSGIVEQIVDGGGHVYTFTKAQFDDAKLIATVGDIFTGNSGSNTRYIFTGSQFAQHLFTLPNIVKYQNVNDVDRKFEYDFKRIRLMNNTLLNASHPLMDKCGATNWAIVLDQQYVQRRVFRSLEESELGLKEAGILDAKSSVWCEISSVILKYPQCHAIIVLTD